MTMKGGARARVSNVVSFALGVGLGPDAGAIFNLGVAETSRRVRKWRPQERDQQDRPRRRHPLARCAPLTRCGTGAEPPR